MNSRTSEYRSAARAQLARLKPRPRLQKLGPYVIRPSDVDPSWVALYVITWCLAWICAIVRFGVVYAILWVLALISGWPIPVHLLAILAGWAPLILSPATLVLPLGGWWWEQTEGARSPSARERATFEAAFSELTAADPSLSRPHRLSILDVPEANAFVYADTLMITRGALEDPILAALLGHEANHWDTSDGRVSAALHRLTTPPRRPVGFPVKTIAFLATGQLAISLTKVPWAIYWRQREKAADLRSYRLGQGAAFAVWLEVNGLAGDEPTPFRAFTSKALHPWTEHRIDKLETE
jgi:Zn-dependent protease with chaperone function